MSEIKGDLRVKRSLNVERRVNQGASAETITSQRNITLHDYSWLRLTNASTQDVVLPDATTLPLGWKQVIDVPTASGASVNVMTYDAVTPVLLKNILADRAYEFILVGNGTAVGTWKINFLEEADLLPAERYLSSFNATTDWGAAAGGYYTITVTQAVHERGTMPIISVEELSGADFIRVEPDRILVLANGNVSIRVPETPDLRFAGRMIFI